MLELCWDRATDPCILPLGEATQVRRLLCSSRLFIRAKASSTSSIYLKGVSCSMYLCTGVYVYTKYAFSSLASSALVGSARARVCVLLFFFMLIVCLIFSGNCVAGARASLCGNSGGYFVITIQMPNRIALSRSVYCEHVRWLSWGSVVCLLRHSLPFVLPVMCPTDHLLSPCRVRTACGGSRRTLLSR